MEQKNKSSLRILFLTIFLNLTGFAIILPLYPAMLGFYLPAEEVSGGLIGGFISFARSLAKTLGQGDSLFMTTVAFGCILNSMYAFLQFVFAPIWGRISDKWGRRRILLITLAGTAISSILWIFASTFGCFVLARVLAGIMAGNLSVATAAAADLTSKENRTKGMALVGAAFGMGFLFGPVIGGLLTQVNLLDYFPALSAFGINPFSMPAIIASLLAIINFFWAFSRFKETLPIEKRTLSSKQQTQEDSLNTPTPGIKKTNLIYFIYLLSFSGLEFTLSFLATERFAYSSTQVGYLFLYIGFILVLTQGFIIRKISRIAPEKAIAFGGILSAIFSFIILAFANSQTIFFIGSGFTALSVGLASPSLSGLVSLYASESTQGHHLGLFRSAGSLARACGPLGAAILYFCFGAQFAYLSVALLLIGPLSLVFALPKPDKSAA